MCVFQCIYPLVCYVCVCILWNMYFLVCVLWCMYLLMCVCSCELWSIYLLVCLYMCVMVCIPVCCVCACMWGGAEVGTEWLSFIGFYILLFEMSLSLNSSTDSSSIWLTRLLTSSKVLLGSTLLSYGQVPLAQLFTWF